MPEHKAQSYVVLPVSGDDGVNKGEFSVSQTEAIKRFLQSGLPQNTVVKAYRARKEHEEQNAGVSR